MDNPKKSPLPKILQIFALVLMGIFSLTGLAAAYIIFAPDDLPKPFYLQYDYPTPMPEVTQQTDNNTEPTPESVHIYQPGEGNIFRRRKGWCILKRWRRSGAFRRRRPSR